ncbi:MAG: hypothetical protein VKK62_08750 [Synechococcaceae cyanobacterium]|nr:hypothetical protein [Synechococcaceae cyanobacterium]
MTPHQLGLSLRSLVLQQRAQGQRPEPQRLQAVIQDLCAAEHQALMAPLRALVLSPSFAAALAQEPPLGDPRLLALWDEELSRIYAAPLCQQLQPLLQGLLGLPAAAAPAQGQAWSAAAAAASAPLPDRSWSAAAPAPAAPQTGAWSTPAPSAAAFQPAAPAVAPPAPAAAPASPAAAPGGQGVAVTLLAFLSGVLLMLVVAMALWIGQQRPPLAGQPNAPAEGTPSTPRQPSPQPLPAPGPDPVPAPSPATTPPAEAIDSQQQQEAQASAGRAVGAVEQLYAALAAKDYSRARSLFGSEAADQFEPSFFDQFEQVSVQDLQVTRQLGSDVELEGVVTFTYPDRSEQSETRRFLVDASGDQPLITASSFGRVIRARR